MNDESRKRLQELAVELSALQHAMQSGVALEMKYDPKTTDPKHLRVGLNSVLVFNGALIKLLVDKGVFTAEEYAEYVLQAMKEEVAKHEKAISEFKGVGIKLR